MPIRSMTGFSQVRGQVNSDLTFSLSLKSVNHRFLDLHFRMPADCDGLEMKLRRALKEKIARGHIDVTLNLERAGKNTFVLNKDLVCGYVAAFRTAATEFGVAGEPDLNAIFRMPGAMDANVVSSNTELDSAVLDKLEEALVRLNQMRDEEGRGIEHELQSRMSQIEKARTGVGQHRTLVLQAYTEKLKSRMLELLGSQVDSDRIAQEAALLVDRSDIQEELVRLGTHVKHFLALLDQGGEIGKKLDFLLQELNREANTLLSKTSGLAGEALKITEMGLAIKSEIEKAREQVQNLE
jgi:uncharacterized protein (TIGR00255 family)